MTTNVRGVYCIRSLRSKRPSEVLQKESGRERSHAYNKSEQKALSTNKKKKTKQTLNYLQTYGLHIHYLCLHACDLQVTPVHLTGS